MSNIEIDPEDVDPILEAAGKLREDDPEAEKVNPVKAFVKPTIHVDPVVTQDLEGVFTSDQLIALAKVIENSSRKAIAESRYDPNMPGQVLPKSAAPITDFSKLSIDDVYDLSIPIEAKEFMSADVLTVKLKDSNYEARWVNMSPLNLGDKIAKGFTYIQPRDLIDGKADAIQASLDAEGHYRYNDVIAMKIDKATYYAALRAAHIRSVKTTNETISRERAAKNAQAFMEHSTADEKNPTYNAGDYKFAARNKKMVFYNPEIGV